MARIRYEDIVVRNSEPNLKRNRIAYEDIHPHKDDDEEVRGLYKVYGQTEDSASKPRVSVPSQNNSFLGNLARQALENAAKEYALRQSAAQRMKISDNPTYAETRDEINRLQNIRGGEQRRGRDDSAYAKAIEMLKEYSGRFSLDGSTSPKDRQALYEDKKKELATKKEALNHLVPDNVSKEEQLAIGLSKDKERVAASQEIKDLEQELKTYERDYSADFYNKYKSADDFEKLSQKQDIRGSEYKPQDLFENLSNPFTGYSPEKDEEDKLGAYLQAIENESSWAKDNIPDDLRHSWLPGFYTDEIIKEGDQNYWKLINDDEKAMYYYLYNKEGKDAAYEYLNKLSPVLGRRNIGNMEAEAAGSEGLDLILRNIDTIPAKLGGSFTSVADDAANLVTGKEINPYSSAHELSHFADVTRAATSEKIDTATNGFNINGFSLGDAYQAGMSAADMVAASTLFGGNEAAVGLVMSMDAARSKAQELYEKGATNEQIISESLAAGAFEAIFETVSLDLITDKIIKGMLTKKTAPRFIAAALMSAGVEGSEEVFTDIANYVTDIIIMKDKSERQQLIQNYLDAGYSQSEAEEKANADFVQNLYESFMGGAVAGGIFGGTTYGSSAATAASANAQERAAIRNTGAAIYDAQNIKSLIDAGKSSSDEAVRKQAEKTEKLYNQSDNKSSRKLNKAAGTLYQQLQERNVSDVTAATDNIRTVVSNAVVTATGSENAVAESAIIKAEITGDQLTAEEQAAINTPEIQTAIQELRESGELNNAVTSVDNALSNYAKTTNLRTERTDEDLFTSNDDGKTYVKGSDKPINIMSIASVGADDITMRTDDGETVSAKDIDFPNSDTAAVLAGLIDIQKSVGTKMSSDVANVVMTAANIGINNGTYSDNIGALVNDVRNIYQDAYWHTGTDTPAILTQGDAQEIAKVAQAEVRAASETPTIKKPKKSGAVVFEDGVKRSDYKDNSRRGVSIDLIENLAQATGITFHFYKSEVNQSGKRVSRAVNAKLGTSGTNAPNGFYQNGEIWIDVNAGTNGEGLILFTASHELVHFIKEGSPADFNALAEFLMDKYSDKKKNVHNYIQAEMRRNHSLTPNEAYEEVVARMCESFLTDIHLSDKAAELYKKNRSLAEKIRDWLSKFRDRIATWYKGVSQNSQYASDGQAIAQKFNKAYDLYIQGIRNASENMRNAKQSTKNGKVKHSFVGRNAITADIMTLEEAKQMEDEGESSDDNVKYDSRDDDYMSAVERGDMETAQRMVDEAAERAFADSKIRTKDGKLRKVYHGTYSDTFTVFDKKLIGTARGGDVGFFGKGFYFAFTEGEAGMYGKNLIDAYLDIKNPFDFQKKLYTYQGERSDLFHGDDAAFIVNFSDLFPELSDNHYVSVAKAGSDDIIKLSLKKFADEFKKYYNGVTFNVQKINSDYGDVWLVTAGKKKVEYTDYKGNKRSFIDYDFQQKFYDEKSAKNRINQVYSYLEKVVYDYIDLPVPRYIIQETEFSNALKNRGYDGVIQSEDGDEIVAFESSQIKSADPVTYDDNGNIIPLSQRFDTSQQDIRYDSRVKFDDWAEMLSWDDDVPSEDASDTELIRHHLVTHNEAIGEILNRTRDMKLSPEEMRRNIKAVLSEYGFNRQSAQNISRAVEDVISVIEAGIDMSGDDILHDIGDAVYNELLDGKYYEEGIKERYDELTALLSSYKKNGMKFYLTDRQLSNLKEIGMTFAEFRAWAARKENGMLQIVKDKNLRGATRLNLKDLEYFRDVFNLDNDSDWNWDSMTDEAPRYLYEGIENLKRQMEINADEYFRGETDEVANRITAAIIADVVEKKYKSAYGGKSDLFVKNAVNRAVEQAVSEQQKIADERVLAETERSRQYVEETVAALRAERDAAIQEQKKKDNERIAEFKRKQRERTERLVKQEKDKRTEQRKTEHDRRKRTELRGKIRRLKESFDRRLTKPKEGQYIPRELISQTVSILNAIDLDSYRSTRLTEKIKGLYAEYEKLKNNSEAYAVYDPVMSSILENLSDTVGDTSIMQMSLNQLGTVYQSLRSLDEVIRNSVRMVDSEFKQTAHAVGREWIAEINQVKGHRRNPIRDYNYSMLRTDVMFNRIAGWKKNSISSRLCEMLNNGQLRMTQLEMEFSMIFDDLMTDYKQLHSLSDTKNLVDIGLKDQSGNTVKITRGMMLSLYMHLLNEDNARHVMGGGLTVPDMKSYYRGDMSNAYGNGQTSVRADVDYSRYVQGLKSAIEEILTPYEMAWIDAAAEFFDVASKNAINETTMTLYHFNKATVNNYFPIHTDPDYRAASFDDIRRDMSLENSGFMKERVHASNPILLEDITDVINNQIQMVAKYCGMTIAIKNFEKVYGTTTREFESSVQKALKTKFSGSATSYIDNLLTDLTSGRTVSDKLTKFNNRLGKVRGNLAQATLTLNPSVAFSQAASYPTAAAVIGWKPLMKAIAVGGKNGHPFSRADKTAIADVSPLLWKRQQGYSTVEIGDLKNKRVSKHKTMNKLKKAFAWIEFFDGATVGRLYTACEYYVDENYKELKKGSEEYKEKVAETYNRVIERTQPNYTTMQRPDILRNPNEIVKSLTMFMTQRLQNFNIVYDAIGEYIRTHSDLNKGLNGVTAEDNRQARVKLWRAVSSQLAAAMTIVAMKTLVNFALYNIKRYKDDDDELTAENLWWGILDNFADTILGNVLFGSDVYSLFKNKVFKTPYYGLSMSGVDSIKGVLDAFTDLDFSDLTLDDAHKLILSGCQLFGIPLKNGEKIGTAAYYFIKDGVEGTLGEYEQDVNRTAKQNMHRIELNYLNGDTERARDIHRSMYDDKVNDSLAKGETKQDAEKKAKSYMKGRYTATYKERYVEAIKNNDTSTANDIRNILRFSGVYEDLDKTLEGWTK